jgi:hypothetical protein
MTRGGSRCQVFCPSCIYLIHSHCELQVVIDASSVSPLLENVQTITSITWGLGMVELNRISTFRLIR